MAKNTRQIAVLTGDLVHSTELGPEKIERAFTALENCAKVQEDWHGAPLHFTRHRGDGWQVVLARPEMALRSALAFRAALRAEGTEFDSYTGIAEGEVAGEVGPDLNDETGDAFRASGDTLEDMKTGGYHRLFHDSQGPLNAAIALADSISSNWTPTQAAAILPFLAPGPSLKMTTVAKSLGKSRQAVAKSLEAANILPLSFAVNSIEGFAHA